MTGAFPRFSLGVLVMGKALWKLVENAQCFPRRGGRVCASAAPAASTGRVRLRRSGSRGALLHLPRVQLVKSLCHQDLRCTWVIFQPERWGQNSQVWRHSASALIGVIMLCGTNIELPPPRVKLAK